MTIKENHIEDELINKLTDLKYIYREDIKDRDSLEINFRQKFEELNRVKLTDNEFSRLLEEIISGDVFKNSNILRTMNTFEREDGTPLHYTLVNIKNWCKNSFEVINQLRINTQNSNHRYDVILLLNGLPLVQVELKNLEISPRRAIQQIVDYKNDLGNGYNNTLLCFVQLFIVSNRTNTWYFSNNNNKHFSFNADERFLPIYQFADKANNKITKLDKFAETFLAKCRLGEIISRYMVLVQSEQKLMIMRPYQVYAVESIVECIDENRGNGYIWHTTGSGKTLTSFKASTLLKDNSKIEKCLFVVDRKDLDRQTREEFNKFQENCVEENTNTHTLVKRLLSTNYADKVIVTTIQKLGIALSDNNKTNENNNKTKMNYKELLEPLRDKRIVFIFGDNHQAIKNFFPRAQLFGFTGTPIFEENATYKQIDGEMASLKTTTDIFEKELHSYTITNAIDDRNVLRFHIDYFKPDNKNLSLNKSISKKAVIESIAEKHNAVTANRKFNALFATSSIDDAIDYFNIFKGFQEEQKKNDDNYEPLNICCVFSPPAEGNKDVAQLQEDLPQEKADNEVEPNRKKEALIEIIADYNEKYKTNHSISNFDSYYQDLQDRIKNQKYSNQDYPHLEKIDIVIVVDMLLTGFDSKYLNALYVDKNLKHHGLIQAFSRTNRVLNDTKPYGNILDFRSQQNAVDEAIALFSGSGSRPPKEIWLVDPAPVVIEKFKKASEKLEEFMKAHGLENNPEEVNNLKGDEARASFINTFKEVQRLKTNLEQYTDLTEEQKQSIEEIIPQDTMRAFKSVYLETAQRLKAQQDKGDNTSEIVEQLDFEFVLFASTLIDYDYIMKLIAKYNSQEPKKQKMSKEQLISILKSSANMMEEQEDMVEYINSLEVGKALNENEIKKGYEAFKNNKNLNALNKLAIKHGLEEKILENFVNLILDRMIFDGENLTDLLEPLGLNWKERRVKELELMEELAPLLRKMAKGKDISGLEAYDE
jgi:type I restriction enzyme, R subunit